MAKKNKILEEQKKARRELFELKKSQASGESVPKENKSEPVAILSFNKKIENFWYYNKKLVILGVVGVLILALLISQCRKRINYDAEIIYFTFDEPVMKTHLDETAEYFEQFTSDVTGNDKVQVLVVNCSIDGDDMTSDYSKNIINRLQAIVAGNPKAMLYITDERSMEYLNSIDSDADLFDKEPFVLPDEFYKKTESATQGKLPKGLQISCRALSKTALEAHPESEKYHKSALEFMEKFTASFEEKE